MQNLRCAILRSVLVSTAVALCIIVGTEVVRAGVTAATPGPPHGAPSVMGPAAAGIDGGAPTSNSWQIASREYETSVSDDGLLLTASGVLEGNQAGAWLGYPASAGDVNGDGYEDVIVGAPGYDVGGLTNAGAAFIFLGSATGIASGNPATAATRLVSNQAGAQFGTSVAGAGDVNGDGYDDVIVGAPCLPFPLPNTGAVYVFHGGPTGIPDGGVTTANTTRYGGYWDDYAGYSVASAGDVNGDGYDDVIVGAFNGHCGCGGRTGSCGCSTEAPPVSRTAARHWIRLRPSSVATSTTWAWDTAWPGQATSTMTATTTSSSRRRGGMVASGQTKG